MKGWLMVGVDEYPYAKKLTRSFRSN